MKILRLRSLRPASIAISLLCALFIQSCVDENILELPPPTSSDSTEYVHSTAIISLLRAVERGSLTADNDCFTLFYPVELQFNNDLEISIDNFDGLAEVAANLTEGQHIDAVKFPILVSKFEAIQTIENDDELTALLEECEYVTLRDEFDQFYTQCFDFTYPIEMIDVNETIVTINNQQEYFAFELLQGFDKQPRFVFPLEVEQFSTNIMTAITNNYELFEVFDGCDKCPQLFFETDFAGGTRWIFRADFPPVNQLETYEWYINDDLVEVDGLSVQGDNTLEETFSPGTYKVCIRYSSEEADCLAGVEYCETIVVEDPCPELSFETNQISDVLYEFIANFDLRDEIDYTWAIYREQDLIFEEFEDASGDDALEFQFDPGSYLVCIEAEVEGCPEVVKFCEEIIVP